MIWQKIFAAALIAAGLDGYTQHPTDPWFVHTVTFVVFMIGLSWYVEMIVDERRK